jgi:hypothetical protein
VFGQNVTEHNPAPSPSGHPLLSGRVVRTDLKRYSPDILANLYLSIYLSRLATCTLYQPVNIYDGILKLKKMVLQRRAA